MAAILGIAGCDAPSMSTSVEVIDGDGLRYDGQSVRLSGIDAPEIGQICITEAGRAFDCGTAMKNQLIEDVRRNPVECFDTGERSFNRVIGKCTISGRDLGAYLIFAGRARAHPDYATPAYLQLEAQARAAGRGLWATQMQAPWDYRRAKRRGVVSSKSSARAEICPVKGNISRKGDMIYHMPGQRDYLKTIITPDRGERCFQTEEEAQLAGWRKAQR